MDGTSFSAVRGPGTLGGGHGPSRSQAGRGKEARTARNAERADAGGSRAPKRHLSHATCASASARGWRCGRARLAGVGVSIARGWQASNGVFPIATAAGSLHLAAWHPSNAALDACPRRAGWREEDVSLRMAIRSAHASPEDLDSVQTWRKTYTANDTRCSPANYGPEGGIEAR